MDSTPEHESPLKEGLGGVGSGLIGLHKKGTLQGNLSILPRKWLTV